MSSVQDLLFALAIKEAVLKWDTLLQIYLTELKGAIKVRKEIKRDGFLGLGWDRQQTLWGRGGLRLTSRPSNGKQQRCSRSPQIV